MRGLWGWIGFLCVIAPSAADARPVYKDRLPNDNMFDCTLCHDQVTPTGPPVANVFGQEAENNIVNGQLNWLALYALDSDEDGAPNGAELGDPCGSFDIGETPPRTTDITNPGNAGSECVSCGPVCDCGDGIDDATEECDGDDFTAGEACIALGYASNAGATCNLTCDTVDTSGCAAECGNGVMEPGEDCDDGNDSEYDNCSNNCRELYGLPTNDNPSSSGCSTVPPMTPALFFMLFTFRRRRPPIQRPGSGSSSTGS